MDLDDDEVREKVKEDLKEEYINFKNQVISLGYKSLSVDETCNILKKEDSILKMSKKRDPKKGTGKKPKGSGRRLYTDENPKDTCRVSFTSVSAIQKTFSSSCFKSKSHARQSQIINLVHQRVRAAYRNAKDPKVKARLKKAFEYAKKRKESSKEKTKRLRKKKRK